MTYGDLYYGEGYYKYLADTPIFIDLNHNYCLHYGFNPEHGQGWAQRNGENWVWPESQGAILTIVNGMHRQEIVYDENDGLPYIIDTRDGPADSGLVKVWKDKVDPFDSNIGTDTKWAIVFGEYTGELEQYYLDILETFLNVRPVDIKKVGLSDYDSNGFPLSLKIDYTVIKDGKIDPYAKMTGVPIKRDVVVSRKERGNSIQIALTGVSSEFRLRKIESFLKVSDLPHNDTTLSEQNFQAEFSDCIVWICRESGLLNRANGQLLAGVVQLINGPANIINAGFRVTQNIALINSSLTDGTAILWRKTDYIVPELALIDYETYGDWILSYLRGVIPANIIIPPGDVADVRILNTRLTDDAIANYYDNICNHNGDVYLP